MIGILLKSGFTLFLSAAPWLSEWSWGDWSVRSGGIPRVINLLSEHALISANAAQQHVISPEMI